MTRLPGAASTLLRPLLTGPPRRAVVVGRHATVVHLQVGAEVLAVETADAVGLPGAVRLGTGPRAGAFDDVRPGAVARLGSGEVRVGPLTVTVARWWAPRRPRSGLDPGAVAALARLLADHPPPVPADAPVGDLVGLGPGLTPAGDDVLAGLLVGLHHAPGRRDEVAREVMARTGGTTALSATLLRHATLGHGVPALLDVADHLAGHGGGRSLPAALERLRRVGHTSGTALAWGLLRGARTLAGPVEEAA